MEYKVSKLGRTTPLKFARWVFRYVDEHVHRTFAKLFAWFDVGGLLSRDVHRQQRIKIKIGIDADSVRLLFGDHRALCLGIERKYRRNKKAQNYSS